MIKLDEAGKRVWERSMYPHTWKEGEVSGITYGDWLVGQALNGSLSAEEEAKPDSHALYALQCAIATCNKLGEV